MTHSGIFALTFAIVGFCLWTIAIWNYDKKKIESIFTGRERLSRKEFYEKYFSGTEIPEELVTKVIDILEAHLGYDLSRLYKEDDFKTNLAHFFVMDDMSSVDIVVTLEEDFSIKITDDEAKNAHTIEDIILLAWGKCNSKNL